MTCLEETAFTMHSPEVHTALDAALQGAGCADRLSRCRAILAYVNAIPEDKVRLPELFWKRQVAEILRENLVSGCSDIALTGVVLSRAAGIPALVVYTLRVESLREYFRKDLDGDIAVAGHSYVKIQLEDGSWLNVESRTGFVHPERYLRPRKPPEEDQPLIEYFEAARGLDFSGLYLRDPATGLFAPAPPDVRRITNRGDLAREFLRRCESENVTL